MVDVRDRFDGGGVCVSEYMYVFYHKQEGKNGEEEEEQEDKKWAVHSWRTLIWGHVYRLIVLPQ